jgi:hypothetical protein
MDNSVVDCGDWSVVRTMDGRKMKRPSNLHGYSGSSPFLSPNALMVSLLVLLGCRSEDVVAVAK